MTSQGPTMTELRSLTNAINRQINRDIFPSTSTPPLDILKEKARRMIRGDEQLSDDVVLSLARTIGDWEGDDALLEPLWLYEGRSRWPRGVQTPLLGRYRRVFVPIVSDNHWRLAIIDVQAHQIDHFDSMPCPRTARRDEERFDAVQDETNEKRFKLNQVLDCARQNDTHSCGIYVLAFIKAIAEHGVENAAIKGGDINIEEQKQFWAEQIDKMERCGY